MAKPRILVGLVSLMDFCYIEFMKSVLHLDLTGLDVEWFFTGHSITSAARNTCAAKAVGEGYDFLVFLDMDMSFHPQTLRRLVAHDVDIVSAMYRARRGDPGPFFAFNFDADGVPRTVGSIDMTGPELIKVDGLPTGCLCIKTHVFRRLDEHAAAQGVQGPNPAQPFFFYNPRMDRLVFDREKQMFEASAGKRFVDADVTTLKPGFGNGEDLAFCRSCKEAGVELYVDTRLVAGHLAIREYGKPALYTEGQQ